MSWALLGFSLRFDFDVLDLLRDASSAYCWIPLFAMARLDEWVRKKDELT